MKLKIVIIICLFFIPSSAIHYLELKNGDHGEVSIVDTTGNSIKFIRNGKGVTLKKIKVKYAVIGFDTINYENYIEKYIPAPQKIIQPTCIECCEKQYFNSDIITEQIDTRLHDKTSIFTTKLKFLGCLQISGSIINEMIVIYDANRTIKSKIKIGNDEISNEVDSEWNVGHTMLSILNGMFLVNGIVMIKVDF